VDAEIHRRLFLTGIAVAGGELRPSNGRHLMSGQWNSRHFGRLSCVSGFLFGGRYLHVFRELIMKKVLPILAAVSIGLFATSAMAQSSNTADPGSAPKASATGGKPSGSVNRANTADPGSAPGASATGGKPSGSVNKTSTADPGSASGAGKSVMKKKSKKKKKSSM
jgi:hypothetical protein